MTTQVGSTAQPTITLTLTAHEAYALWLGIDGSRNTVVRAVEATLQRYTRAHGVKQ